MNKHALLAASTALLAPALAVAAEESYPRLTGEVVIEVENDFTFDSDDRTAEINDLFNTTEAAVAFELSPLTAFNATLLIEPVRDPGPNDDRVFEDHGLFVEELYLSHDFGSAAIVAGKFNPAFGFAWDAGPGLYGSDFAEDYELTERLGGAVEIPFAAGSTTGAFAVSVFMADRTLLSDSLGATRGDTDRADGGVSNTKAPESVIASVYAQTGSVAWNLGARRQAKGVGDTDDEFGFVAGALTSLEGSGVDLLGEVAYFPNFDGGAAGQFNGTFGVGAPVGPAYLSAAYSLREVQNATTDHLLTASAEFEIAEGASIGVGYKFAEEGGVDSHTVGALFVYEFGF